MKPGVLSKELRKLIKLQEKLYYSTTYPVKVKLKGKTVGRPSKLEKTASAIITYQMNIPEVKAQMIRMMENLYMFGNAHIELPNTEKEES